MTQVLDRIRNGVDSAQMYGTLDAIKENPALGIFQFRAQNHWIDGAHNRSTIKSFYGAGQEDTHPHRGVHVDAGEPPILLGVDTGPNPAEYLLHALAACLTTTLVYVATARKVRLTEVESTLEGDMDVRGALGLSDEVRNGFTNIRVNFKVKGDAPRGEAARARRARPGPLRRLRHGRQRRARRGHASRAVMLELTAHDRGGRPPGRARRDARRRSSRRAAPQHDREATFPHDSIDALKRAGYFTAPIPAEYGGLGVTSVHDVVVASGRLARGDASVAIGVNMHLVVLLNIVRRWQAAVAAGDARRVAAFGASMEAIARDGVDHGRRDLRARPGPDAARARRRPAPTRLADRRPQGVLHRLAGGDRPAHRGHVHRRRRRGALRLRAVAAGRARRRDPRRLGRARHARLGQPLGDASPASRCRRGAARRLRRRRREAYMERNLSPGCSTRRRRSGIAEARGGAATRARRKRGEPDARTRMLVAENAIELGARARRCRAPRRWWTTRRRGALVALFAETQAAKAFVNEASARIVDRALAASGGAGYLNGHPLARAYRDVRAGSFMHPLGANRAYDFLGDVALGREVVLH